MPNYDVYAFCNICGGTHPSGIGFTWEDGPDQKTKVADAFDGIELPPGIVTIKNNYFKCKETGEMYLQEDNDQLFLVPIK